jgi:VanZ family protein
LLDFLESHKNKLVYLPLIIYWIVLFVATSLPGNDLPNLGVSDKIEHFVAYFILAIFLNLALTLQTKFKWLKQKANFASILIISIYAGLDELHQIFIPGRSCDIRDWITDFMATCLAVLLMNMLFRQIKNKTAK